MRVAIIVLILIGITIFHVSDFNYYLDKNPGKIVVLFQPDKNEGNVIFRTDDGSYGRFRFTQDSIAIYKGRLKRAEYHIAVSYFRTYGVDKWVELRRKRTLVTVNITELKDRVILRKTTPYYAYYRSGSGGTLVEELTIMENRSKLRFIWTPSDTRMKSAHRLEWKINSRSYSKYVESDPVKIGDIFTVGAETGIATDGMRLDWRDALGMIDSVNYSDSGVTVGFIPSTGVIDIDPFVDFGIYSSTGSSHGTSYDIIFDSGGSNSSAYLRVPRNASEIVDSNIVMSGYSWSGSFPTDLSVTVNGTTVWSLSGELNASNSPQALINLTTDALNNELDECDTPSGTFCLLDLMITSSAAGNVSLSLNYSYTIPVMDISSPLNLSYLSTPTTDYVYQSTKFYNVTLRLTLKNDDFYDSEGLSRGKTPSLSFAGPGSNASLYIRIPVNATVLSASFDVSGP